MCATSFDKVENHYISTIVKIITAAVVKLILGMINNILFYYKCDTSIPFWNQMHQFVSLLCLCFLNVYKVLFYLHQTNSIHLSYVIISFRVCL